MKGKKHRIILTTLLMMTIWLMGAVPAEFPEELTYESPVFTDDGAAYYPADTMEKDGKQYRLLSVKTEPAVREGEWVYASTSVSYLLEGEEEPPETTMIRIEDSAAGTSYEREVSILDTEEISREWEDTFSFPVTVSGYDADIFYLGEREIQGTENLADYGPFFLEYLGLSEDYYRVDTVLWDGDAYEQDGMILRNAVAYGEKLVRNVEAAYGGDVRTPDINGKRYVGLYEEILPETEAEESASPEETAEDVRVTEEETEETPDRQMPDRGTAKRVIEWLKHHLTVVTFGGAFFFVLLAAAILLWMSGKRKEDRK